MEPAIASAMAHARLVYLVSAASVVCMMSAAPDLHAEDELEGGLARAGNADDRSYSGDLTLSGIGPLIGQYGGTFEVMLASHHAIAVSPYYVSVESVDPTKVTGADGSTRLFTNHVHGVGGELAYRFFWGDRGPHGLFVSPAWIVGALQLDEPRAGESIHYWKLGGAIDIGYQAVLNRVVLCLSAGLQYTQPSKSLPAQNALLDVQTDPVVHPRATAAIGYAF